jgi:hypothetical protein
LDRIILGSADRLSVAQVARRAGVGRPAVWRWQRRFAEAGVDGLLQDATRKPGKGPLGDRRCVGSWRSPVPSRRASAPYRRVRHAHLLALLQ